MTARWRAAVLPAPREELGGALSPRAWRSTVVGFHVVFVVLLAISAATTATLGVEGSRPAVLSALAVLALAYALLGAPSLGGGRPVRAAAYLAVLVAVFAVLAWQAPSLLFLLFLGFPQVWFLVASVPVGVAWTLALAVASTTGPFVRWLHGDEPLEGVLRTLVGLAFSLVMGLWVNRVLEQSEERGALIAQLEATRAELAAAHHERGVLAERERLAREVHDTLAQGYTSIVVLAQTVAAQVPVDPAAALERVALIEEVARDNLAEARAMVAAFAPAGLDDGSLREALERLAARFGRETGLATRVDTGALAAGPPLRRGEEIVLLRGAQEALTNVRRHAHARAVVLRVSRVGGCVQVQVEDDGVGFDPARAVGHGLTGLRSRAGEVGGGVDVASVPGQGTRVTVRVPAREQP